MNTQPLARASTHIIELSGFQDALDGSYPTTATGVLVLLNPDGSVLVDAIAVTRDALTSGPDTIYRGELAHTVVLVKGTTYEAALTVTIGVHQRTFHARCPVPE